MGAMNKIMGARGKKRKRRKEEEKKKKEENREIGLGPNFLFTPKPRKIQSPTEMGPRHIQIQLNS
jgi:hypothetical protein